MTPPDSTGSTGAASHPAASEAPLTVPVPAVVVQHATADATVQPTSKPPSTPKAARPTKAAPAAKVATGLPPSLSGSSIVPSQVLPGIAPSRSVAGMSDDDLVSAFLGQPVVTAEQPAPPTDPDDTATPTPEEEVDDTATEGTPEGEEEQPPEPEEEETIGKSSPLDGLSKELQKLGAHPKLISRVLEMYKGAATAKAQLQQLEQRPATVLAASAADPLAQLTTATAVDENISHMQQDARGKLRWLNRHAEGGIWAEGTEQEKYLSPEQVDKLITYYENIRDEAPRMGEGRKAYLAQYAESHKSLTTSAADLVNPSTPTRESQLIRSIPELMRSPDYLLLLEDLQAGRSLREQRAAGKRVVYLDTKAPATTPKQQQQAAPTTSSSRPAAPPVRSSTAGPSLAELRARAAKGDSDASDELAFRMSAA